jgi:hypothetical protein
MEMLPIDTANRSAAASTPPALRAVSGDLPSRQCARRTNDPLAGLNRNTARGRRIADLTRSYLQAIGNPDDTARQAAAIAAAELQVLAEETRAAALREPLTADLDNLVRVQSIADRALRRLGIKGTPQKPPLAEYLASKQLGAAP